METFKNSLCFAVAVLALVLQMAVVGGRIELPTSIHYQCITTSLGSNGCAFLVRYNEA